MGWPVLFSALTTFAALLSFLAIPMQPMRFIGIATSSCVMLAFFIAITLMPVLLSFGKNGKPHPKVQETGGRWLDPSTGAFGRKRTPAWHIDPMDCRAAYRSTHLSIHQDRDRL